MTFENAANIAPFCRKTIVSKLKLENVVNPPNTPMIKQPSTLTQIIPHGKFSYGNNICTVRDNNNRATEPIAPPAATTIISFERTPMFYFSGATHPGG